MRRGDFVTVVVAGDYGKPRPAIVIQSDFIAETDSVLVCLLTTTHRNAPFYRLPIPVLPDTGLREPSQIMVDKIMAIRRDRCSVPIGRAGPATMLSLGRLLAFVVGVAD